MEALPKHLELSKGEKTPSNETDFYERKYLIAV